MSSAPVHWYRELWERHWWWRSREALLRNEIASIAKESRIDRILDVGCGDGLFFDFLSTVGEVQGLEPDPFRVQSEKWAAKIRIAKIDSNLNIEKSFDFAVMLDVLEHIDDVQDALAAVSDALTPAGRLLITVPALPMLWSRHDESEGHFRRYTPSSLRESLREAGFQVESLRYFFGWTVGPMLIRRKVVPPGASKEMVARYRPQIPPEPISTLLEWMSRAEHFIGRRFFPLPIGSSLLALARSAEHSSISNTGSLDGARPSRASFQASSGRANSFQKERAA